MDSFEQITKKLIGNLKNFSLIEFYHEEDNINKQIKNMSDRLDRDLEGYLPKSQLIAMDMEKQTTKIRIELKERIKSSIKTIDHDFAIRNYDEICGKMFVNPNIPDLVKRAYKRLGPFDHYEHLVADDEENASRLMAFNWETRPSGTMYKGQMNA